MDQPERADGMEVFLERIRAAVARGGASDADRERLERLFSDDTTFLELTNEEAGSWLRWFSRSAHESWARQRDGGTASDEQSRMGLLTLGLLQLVRWAHETNAGKLNFTMSNVTLDAESVGDWELTLTQLTGDGIDVSELG